MRIAEASYPLSTPEPGWSEQDPADWWTAVLAAVDKLSKSNPADLASVTGIGLSGHMHGATLLGKNDEVLLKVSGLNAFYGRAHILFDVGLEVRRGEVVGVAGLVGVGCASSGTASKGSVSARTAACLSTYIFPPRGWTENAAQLLDN